MNGRTFSPNRRMQGKSDHQHHHVIINFFSNEWLSPSSVHLLPLTLLLLLLMTSTTQHSNAYTYARNGEE